MGYYSVFGKIRFARHYFAAPGHPGCCPLDATLSLPERCYSDLLREWAAFGATDASYRESQTALERILGHQISLQALETGVREDAEDVTAFYAQPPDPGAPVPLGPILVVQADGKGVPQAQALAAASRERLGKGQKRSKKKEERSGGDQPLQHRALPPHTCRCGRGADAGPAPGGAGDPSATHRQGGACDLGREERRADAASAAGSPARGSAGPAAGSAHRRRRKEQLLAHFPAHTLVLDIIHATEYLWDAATALLGETHPERKAWVRRHLEQVVSGATAAVIEDLEVTAQKAELTETQRKALLKTAGYYRRNQPYMHYDEYLARGWPVGTGVVEGACGHLVKDRMEQAGMRWTQDGAQAVLDLRSVRLNGD